MNSIPYVSKQRVPGPPGGKSSERSYCYDFGELFYHDKALILPKFLFMKTVQEVKTTHCFYIALCSLFASCAKLLPQKTCSHIPQIFNIMAVAKD